jgi:hypothetical protein
MATDLARMVHKDLNTHPCRPCRNAAKNNLLNELVLHSRCSRCKMTLMERINRAREVETAKLAALAEPRTAEGMSELGPYERMTDDEKRQYFRDIEQPKPQLITRVEAQALVAAALGRAAQYVHDKGCGWYGAGTPESDACLELLEPGIRALISSDAQAALDALVREARNGWLETKADELGVWVRFQDARGNKAAFELMNFAQARQGVVGSVIYSWCQERLAQLKAEGEKP